MSNGAPCWKEQGLITIASLFPTLEGMFSGLNGNIQKAPNVACGWCSIHVSSLFLYAEAEVQDGLMPSQELKN